MKTLLHLQDPVSGQILIGDGLHRNEIGYLPQQTVVQRDFPASVREIVLSGCQGRCGLRPFYNKEEKRLADENMERMGIMEYANRCYRELSGGQQQRVLLARALCATRKVLLLDEPVSGLDPKVTVEMYSLISDLNREGITIIMISHDIAAAVRYASHILHIGEFVFYGTKDEYLKSDAGKFFLLQQAHMHSADRGGALPEAEQGGGVDAALPGTEQGGGAETALPGTEPGGGAETALPGTEPRGGAETALPGTELGGEKR
jgi:zinc transport system ATP-binding protein